MIVRALSLAVALSTAATVSQGPEFVQQYRQRLGGTIDELARIVALFEEDARAFGISRAEAVRRLTANSDPFASRRGQRIAGNIERLQRLRSQRDALAQAGPVVRLAVFANDADAPLAMATARDFRPAMPLTVEGVVSAVIGLVFGYALVRSLGGLFGLARRRRTRRRA